MSGVGNKFYWRGDEETASIYRPDGKIIATVCKRDLSDDCASTRAIEVTTALNNNHFSRVKPLEWEKLNPVGDMSAETSIGYYEIYFDDEDVDKTPWCVWTLFENLGHFSTIDDAKAAAQSDYERRILSALEW